MDNKVVLFSGGIDSMLVADMLKPSVLFTFDYGQSKWELKAAATIAEQTFDSIPQMIIHLPLPPSKVRTTTNIINFRNAMLITTTAALCDFLTVDTLKIGIGANLDDYADYPDCRPKFFRRLSKLLTSCGKSVEITTPLIHKTKREIVSEVLKRGLPIQQTFSCYSPNDFGVPCGVCNACHLRYRALQGD